MRDFFRKELNKFNNTGKSNNTGARMLDFYYHMMLKLFF